MIATPSTPALDSGRFGNQNGRPVFEDYQRWSGCGGQRTSLGMRASTRKKACRIERTALDPERAPKLLPRAISALLRRNIALQCEGPALRRFILQLFVSLHLAIRN